MSLHTRTQKVHTYGKKHSVRVVSTFSRSFDTGSSSGASSDELLGRTERRQQFEIEDGDSDSSVIMAHNRRQKKTSDKENHDSTSSTIPRQSRPPRGRPPIPSYLSSDSSKNFSPPKFVKRRGKPMIVHSSPSGTSSHGVSPPVGTRKRDATRAKASRAVEIESMDEWEVEEVEAGSREGKARARPVLRSKPTNLVVSTSEVSDVATKKGKERERSGNGKGVGDGNRMKKAGFSGRKSRLRRVIDLTSDASGCEGEADRERQGPHVAVALPTTTTRKTRSRLVEPDTSANESNLPTRMATRTTLPKRTIPRESEPSSSSSLTDTSSTSDPEPEIPSALGSSSLASPTLGSPTGRTSGTHLPGVDAISEQVGEMDLASAVPLEEAEVDLEEFSASDHGSPTARTSQTQLSDVDAITERIEDVELGSAVSSEEAESDLQESGASSQARLSVVDAINEPVEELDLGTLETAGRNLQESRDSDQPPQSTSLAYDDEINPLLELCSQSSPYDFTLLVEHLLYLLPSQQEYEGQSDLTWKKIGEATYSEVFHILSNNAGIENEGDGGLVVKIIPIMTREDPVGDTSRATVDGEDDDEEKVPEISSWKGVMREIEITKLVGGGYDADSSVNGPIGSSQLGFIRMKGAFVVQGAYPQVLLDEWDSYRRKNKEAENLSPGLLEPTQLYVLLCLPHGGQDLEHFRLRNWTEAASVFSQVVRSLEGAEQSLEFEHRDLHWGNVLVQRLDPETHPARGRRKPFTPLPSQIHHDSPRKDETLDVCISPETSGVKATVIDFTLSRAKRKKSARMGGGMQEGEVVYVPLEDQQLFKGEGDYQFDVYRLMREKVGTDWDGFHPLTNVMWLHYLCDKLLCSKGLKEPLPPLPNPKKKGRTGTTVRVVSAHHTRKQGLVSSKAEKKAYDALVLAEVILRKSIQLVPTRNRKTRGKKEGKVKQKAPPNTANDGDDMVVASTGDFLRVWSRACGSGEGSRS